MTVFPWPDSLPPEGKEADDRMPRGELPVDPAEAQLEATVTAPAAVLEEPALFPPEHALAGTTDPQGGQRQHQEQALHPLGTPDPALLPLPAEALEIPEELFLPGAAPVLPTALPTGWEVGQQEPRLAVPLPPEGDHIGGLAALPVRI